MRLLRFTAAPVFACLSLLVSSFTTVTADDLDPLLDISQDDLNTNEFNTNEDEPKIALPEVEQKPNPFRNVSQGVRKDSRDALVNLAQKAVDTTSRRLLSTDQHTPWQMMHALLGLRHDFVIQHQGQTISGLDWIADGQVFDNEYWFEKTRFGGRAHPYNRPYAFEGHANQFVAILSMCGVELDREFGTAKGPVTMRNMIEHGKMTIDLEKDEPTWTLWALSRYLPSDARWRDTKGEVWSIERLVQEQTARPMKGAACGGTHSLFALAHARNVYLRQGKPLRGVWLQAEYKIRKYINTARMQQNSNGTLSSNYFRGRQYNPDFNKRMASAGHVLEFLMIALPQEELKARWIRRAVEATASDLMRNRKAYVKCSPLYHSVNALNIYLDRVNPRSAADVATAEENPRTAMVSPRPLHGTQPRLKGVPAMGISETRELTSTKTEEPVVAAEVKTPATVTPQVTAPVTKPAEPVAEPAEPKQLPVLVKEAPVATDNGVEKWGATPAARRTPIHVPADKINVPVQSSTHSLESAIDESTDTATDDQNSPEPKQLPEPTADPLPSIETTTPAAAIEEKSVERPSANALTIPSPDSIEPTDAGLGLPKAMDDDTITRKSVPIRSVSRPNVLSSTQQTAEPIRYSADGNREHVRSDMNNEFLNAELDPRDWVRQFESKDREIVMHREAIVSAVGPEQGETIADIGAGTGLFLKDFSTAVGDDGQVLAIDISPGLVEYLDDKVGEEQLENVDVVRNDPQSLQIKATRINRAFLCDTYHHFEYPQEMLASIFEALPPGGELVVVDFIRTPGESREWILDVVRADKQTFRAEIQAAGFDYLEEVVVPGLKEHYVLRFRRPTTSQ